MTTEEIKQSTSMLEVVERYGLHPNRAGFISCPFHHGDKTPSMKIYKKDYHCHACGANGDIFSFVQGMEHCDFKTAYKALGGAYKQQSDNQRKLFQYHLQKRKENEIKRYWKMKKEKEQVIKDIGICQLLVKLSEVYSDDWCYSMNRLESLYYKLEVLTNEMRECKIETIK